MGINLASVFYTLVDGAHTSPEEVASFPIFQLRRTEVNLVNLQTPSECLAPRWMHR